MIDPYRSVVLRLPDVWTSRLLYVIAEVVISAKYEPAAASPKELGTSSTELVDLRLTTSNVVQSVVYRQS